MINFSRLFKIFFLKITVVFYFFVFSLTAVGQSRGSAGYTVDQGLSSNIINSICQDENGFIWFGTNEGLNRFDGYEIGVIENPAPDSIRLKSNVIRKVISYDKNLLFLATDNGLYEFNLHRYSFEKILFPVSQNCSLKNKANKIYQILKLHNGKLLISTAISLFEYNPSANSLKDLLKEKKYKPLRGKTIKNLAATDYSLWFVTIDNRLYFERNNIVKKFSFHRQINDVISDGRFVYIIGGGSTFFKIDGKSNQIYDLSDILKKSPNGRFNPIRITKYEKDKFIVASLRFIYSVDLKQKSIRKIETSELYGIKSIITDKSFVLWIATNGLGVRKIDLTPVQFLALSKRKGNLSFLSVRAILPIDNQSLLIGGLNGLNIVNLRTHAFIEIPEFRRTTVYSLLKDNADKNVVWVSVFNYGIEKYNIKIRKASKLDLGSSKNDLTGIRFFKSVKDSGRNLYFGTSRGLLIAKNGGKNFELKKISGQIKGKTSLSEIRALMEDSHKRIWIGTLNSGIFLFNPKRNRVEPMNGVIRIPTSASVNHFFEDERGIIWIATSIGLVKYNEKNNITKIFDKSSGFNNNHIYSILQDEQKNLWLSGGKGIIKFNPSTGNVKIFDTAIDLPSKEFNACAYFKDKNGKMYFGGITGVVIFNPKEISPSKFNASPFFASFTKFVSGVGAQKILSVPAKLILNYSDKYFTVKLASTDFRNPSAVKYRYKLKEGDDWIYLNENERSISFYKLSPGSYNLTISATNSDGVWSDKMARLNILIKPPFWESLWFQSIGAIAIAALIMFFYQRRIKRFETEKKLREEFSQKLIGSQEEEKEKIAGNLHDGLGQNLIVVKNKLLMTEAGKDSKRHLKESIDILSKTITDVSNLSHLLRPVELDQLGLTLAIESMIERFEEITDINFKVELLEIDKYFDKDSAINIFRVFQEALNNIVKHSKATIVKINASIEDNLLKIKIEDNGKGFLTDEPAGNERTKRAHFGIAGMKERLRILHGDFNIDSSEYGTVINLTIPVKTSKS